jgi:hypothetical protein
MLLRYYGILIHSNACASFMQIDPFGGAQGNAF